MQETIQNIMNSTDKKSIHYYGRRLLKKCSFKSSKDMGYLSGVVIWLYICEMYDEIFKIVELIKDVKFTGNYTLWDNFDTIYCFKARILRERGELEEAKEIINFVNQYRAPHLYCNLVDWFNKTLETNIRAAIEEAHSKSREIAWREVKLLCAVRYREAGQFPISDDELEKVIHEQIEILSKEK